MMRISPWPALTSPISIHWKGGEAAASGGSDGGLSPPSSGVVMASMVPCRGAPARGLARQAAVLAIARARSAQGRW